MVMWFCRDAHPEAEVVVGPALDLAQPTSIRHVSLKLIPNMRYVEMPNMHPASMLHMHAGTCKNALHEFMQKVSLNTCHACRQFAEAYKQQERPLHILVNNAGANYLPESYTGKGVGLLCQASFQICMLLVICAFTSHKHAHMQRLCVNKGELVSYKVKGNSLM